jgi:hypothetical protein
MSNRNLLLLAGLVLAGYWFYTRKPNTKKNHAGDESNGDKHRGERKDNIEAEKINSEKVEEPKTIKIDLSNPRGGGRRSMFPESMVKDFDTSKEATIAPPQIRFEQMKQKRRR